jgi:CRP/FNR family cyclic AMP-dependent transcriptional regulator
MRAGDAPRDGPAGIHPGEGPRLLASTPLFHGLTADELGELCRHARGREIRARATVYAPTDAGDALYVLGRGRVCVYRLTPSGRKVILDDLRPPAVFGSAGVFSRHLTGEFAEAAETSLVYKMDRLALEGVLRRRPETALRLLQFLGRRSSELERRIEEMAAPTAEQRLAAVALRLADERGVLAGVTQDELAELTGTVRQTVARVLGQWRRDGLVTVRRRTVQIVRRDAVVQRAAR